MWICDHREKSHFFFVFLQNLHWNFAWVSTVLVYLKLEISNFLQNKRLKYSWCYFFDPPLFLPMLLTCISGREHFKWSYCSSFFQCVWIDKVPKETEKLTSFLTWPLETLLSAFGMLNAGMWNTTYFLSLSSIMSQSLSGHCLLISQSLSLVPQKHLSFQKITVLLPCISWCKSKIFWVSELWFTCCCYYVPLAFINSYPV